MKKIILLVVFTLAPVISYAAEQAVAFYNWDQERYLSFGDPAQVPITFYVDYHNELFVSLRYVDQAGNSRYVTAESDGSAGLHATTIDQSAVFRFQIWADGSYSFNSLTNNNFLVLEGDGTINVNRPARGAWESFHPQAVVETSPTNRQLTPFLPLHHPEYYVIDANDRLMSMNVPPLYMSRPHGRPTSGHHIGTGFAARFPPRPDSNTPRVFSGAAGEFYGIEPNGNLYYYHYDHSKGSWRNPVGELVGSGWNDFVYLSGDGAGSVYGLHTNGHLYRYKHQNGDTSKWLVQMEDLGKSVNVSWRNESKEYPWTDMRMFAGLTNSGDIDAGANRLLHVIDGQGVLWTFKQYRSNGSWVRNLAGQSHLNARFTALSAGTPYYELNTGEFYGEFHYSIINEHPGRPLLGYSRRDDSVYTGLQLW